MSGADGGRRPWFIALVMLAGVALCAIPFLGGLVGIIAGLAMLSSNRRERRLASLHRADDLPPRRISELTAGARVRLRGRVISTPTVTAPVSGRAVVCASVSGTSTPSHEKGFNERKLEPLFLGDVIELEDDTGSAELRLANVQLLSRHVQRHDEHTEGQLPALRAPGCFRAPPSAYLEVEELTIEAGDELHVAGRVEAVEDQIADRPEGYRASAARKRVKLGGGDEPVRISNLTAEELRRVLAMAPGFLLMGVSWLVAAAASLAFWGWRFLR